MGLKGSGQEAPDLQALGGRISEQLNSEACFHLLSAMSN